MTKYQCPACCWVGTIDDLQLEFETCICPNCYVEFDPISWEEADG
jgi:hypothetical protein